MLAAAALGVEVAPLLLRQELPQSHLQQQCDSHNDGNNHQHRDDADDDDDYYRCHCDQYIAASTITGVRCHS